VSLQCSMMAEMLSIPSASPAASSTPRFYAMDARLVVAACAMHN
jgi:hypothetical protein